MKHTLRIKKQYFDELNSGGKSIEVRIGYNFIKSIKVGDQITFENYGKNEFNVVRVTKYNSFCEMLETEPIERVLPGLTKEQALKVYQGFYPPHKERLGVYVFQLEKK